LYPGHGCHEPVLTQFSVHRREDLESGETHVDYLSDASRDCERELALELIGALGHAGSILVYSGFERVRIKALMERFPEHADRLGSIQKRIVDLLPIVRDNIYHPDFKGSFSIKDVLPALVADLSYGSLSIQDGETAVVRFARMAKGAMDADEVETIRADLLEYCKVDTLAMVRLHETLSRLAVPTLPAGSGQASPVT
jgi:hypothetical protein